MQAEAGSAGRLLIAGVAIGLLVLSFGAAAIPATQGREALELIGLVDRLNIKEGGQINFLVNIVNASPHPVKLESVNTLFGSDEVCVLSSPSLAPNQSMTVRCRQTFEKEGVYNLGVQVTWLPETKGGARQQTAKTITQVTVSPAAWYAEMNATWYQSITVVLLFVLLLALASHHPQSQKLFWAFLLGSALVTFSGVIALSAPITIAGLLSTLVSGALVLKGKDFLTNLMDRVTKAGPFEFSPLTIKMQDLEIFKLRERDFLKAETSIDEISNLDNKLDHYIEFLRLRTYSLEVQLLPHNPDVPNDEAAIGRRRVWLAHVQGRNGGIGSPNVFKELQLLYDEIEQHEALQALFNTQLRDLLEAAKKLQGAAQTKSIRSAVDILNDNRASILIPQFFTILARLHRILHDKEKALSILYEGHDRFRDSINTNVLLGWHIGEMNSNYSTALKYECKALGIIEQCGKEVESNYKKIHECVLGGPQGDFTRYLQQKARDHKNGWQTRLTDWFTDLRIQMSNNVAYDIAIEGIASLEAPARKYAEAVHAHKPEEAAYMETLGFVKLRFYNTFTGGKDEDLKHALRLFEQAIYLARGQNDMITLEMAQLHHQEAREMLRRM